VHGVRLYILFDLLKIYNNVSSAKKGRESVRACVCNIKGKCSNTRITINGRRRKVARSRIRKRFHDEFRTFENTNTVGPDGGYANSARVPFRRDGFRDRCRPALLRRTLEVFAWFRHRRDRKIHRRITTDVLYVYTGHARDTIELFQSICPRQVARLYTRARTP